MFEFGIELSIRDIDLIYKIKDLLGIGTIFIRNQKYKDNLDNKDNILKFKSKDKLKCKRNTIIFRIRNKSDLKEYIIPIFDKYPLLTNKQYDYIRFRKALLSNTIYHENLPIYTRSLIPINSVESILNAPYLIP
jgi:LAGLIDADG endonuclease